jgi:Flp pilus assembly pilin Flp
VDRAGGEHGVTAVTYALMVAIIAILLVGGVFVLGGGIQTALNDGAACVSNPGSCEDGNGSGGGGNGGGGTTTSTSPATTAGPTTTTTTTTTGP